MIDIDHTPSENMKKKCVVTIDGIKIMIALIKGGRETGKLIFFLRFRPRPRYAEEI